jgi:hypothetical protein
MSYGILGALLVVAMFCLRLGTPLSRCPGVLAAYLFIYGYSYERTNGVFTRMAMIPPSGTMAPMLMAQPEAVGMPLDV